MPRRRLWGSTTCLIFACSAAVGAPDARGFEQRYLWTWDHRMDWSGKTPGRVVMGGGGRYQKTTAEFLDDYKRLVDYMHEHTSFNAVIIWGFLRDSHGGVEAAQELCDYADARGIRIIPGVGTSGYEGYYFEGDHQYNVTTWLRKHPELRAVGKDGKPHDALCPTNPANVKWLNDGCRWLFENFKFEVNPVTGLKYDTPDYRPTFRFKIGDLWRDGKNLLRIENLERRFRPSELGVLVVGKIEME